VRRIGLTNCPYCGKDDEIYTSRPQTWHDEVCLFFFLQVVRCHFCMIRHYRPLFLPPVPVWSEKPVETIGSEDEQQRPV
jgi:hypothetical protein